MRVAQEDLDVLCIVCASFDELMADCAPLRSAARTEQTKIRHDLLAPRTRRLEVAAATC